MPRPQFTLRSLLVAMLVVGAFFAGAVAGRTTVVDERDSLRRDLGLMQQMVRDLGHDNVELLHVIHENGLKAPTLTYPDVESLDELFGAPVTEK